MNKFVLIIFFLLFLSFCCNREEKDQLLARYKKQKLYLSELKAYMPSDLKVEDSIDFINNYIKKWLEQQVVLDDAKRRCNIIENEIKELLNDYRKVLLQQRWEQNVIESIGIPEVSFEEVSNYYKQNKHEFILSEDVIKIFYARFDKNFKHYSAAIELFSSPRTDIVQLEKFCKQYALNWFLDKDVWLYLSDVAIEVPIKETDRQLMLQGNTFFHFQTDDYLYFMRVLDIKPAGSVAPLSFVEQKIRQLLIHRKQKEVLQNEIKRLYDIAQKKGYIEIFN